MRYFRAFIGAASMFTAIPMPQVEWDMEHGSRMTACFGLIGGALGGLYLLVRFLLGFSGLPAAVCAVLLVAAVHALTGFIHLDGFMDVCDAVLSHRDEEGRRSILKDPHCGSFSVVCLVLTLGLELACVYSLWDAPFLSPALVLVPVLSRSASALLLLSFKTLPGSSLGAYFKTGAGTGTRIFVSAVILASLAAAYFWGGLLFAAVLAAAAALSAAVGLYAAGRLGGVNGDTAGFTVVLGQTLSLLALRLI